MKELNLKHRYFRIFIYIVSVYMIIDSIIELKGTSSISLPIFIISIITSVILGAMVINAGSGSIELTDSIAAFIFISFGRGSVILFTAVYSLIVGIINSRYITGDRSKSRVFFNTSMFIIASYLAAISMEYININRYSDHMSYVVITSTFFIALFLTLNIQIFKIDYRLFKGKGFMFDVNEKSLLAINFVISSIIAIMQCIINESVGLLGSILVYGNLIFIHYCFFIYRKLQIRNESINGLIKITHDLVKYGDFVEKCKHVVINLKNLIPYTICSIYTFDSNSESIAYPIAYNGPEELDIGDLGIDITGSVVKMAAAKEGKIYICKDVNKDKKIKLTDSVLKLADAVVIVPIFIENRVIGLIFIGGRLELLKFIVTGAHDILNIFANQIALAIENDRTYGKIKIKAEMDSLTKLYNRRVFDREIKKLIKTSGEFSLVIYDIDDFKNVNDTYGHLAGDYVLKSISSIIKNSIRKTDIPCRYGGEEIAILFKNLNKEDTYVICERIRKKIESEAFQWCGRKISITISGGVASFPEDGNTVYGLIDSADIALYTWGKGKGKNKIGVSNDKIIKEDTMDNVISI